MWASDRDSWNGARRWDESRARLVEGLGEVLGRDLRLVAPGDCNKWGAGQVKPGILRGQSRVQSGFGDHSWICKGQV